MCTLLKTCILFFVFATCSSKENPTPTAHDDPYALLKIGGTCEQLNQVQTTVIGILGTHYEYGKGIHKLHQMVQQQEGDLVTLKHTISSVESALIKLPQNLGPDQLDASDADSQNEAKRAEEKLDNAVMALQRLLKDFGENITNLTTQVRIQALNVHRIRRKLNRVDRAQKQLKKYSKSKAANAVLSDLLGSETLRKASEVKRSPEKTEDGYMINELSARVKWLEETLGHFLQSGHGVRLVSTSHICPAGFYQHMQSCYMFMNTTATWWQAENYCQHLDKRAHLVSVETQEENDFILKFRLYNNANWTSRWLWAGGHDTDQEGVWRWIGTGQPVSFNYWLNDHTSGPRHEHEDCMYYTWDGDYRWDDWGCDTAKLNFICEIRLLSSENDPNP